MNASYRHVALGLVFQATAITGIGGAILLLRLLTGGLDASSGWLAGAGLALQIQGALLLALVRLWGRAIRETARPVGCGAGVAALLLGTLLQLLSALG